MSDYYIGFTQILQNLDARFATKTAQQVDINICPRVKYKKLLTFPTGLSTCDIFNCYRGLGDNCQHMAKLVSGVFAFRSTEEMVDITAECILL